MLNDKHILPPLAKADDAAWRILDHQEIYAAPPWLRLSRQVVELPNGKIVKDYHQLDLPDFVVAVAMTSSDHFITIRQYKHGARRTSLTLPGGMVEADEPPSQAARRELLEETGYAASVWRHIGSYIVHGNLGAGCGHYFLAHNAKKVQAASSGDLEEMEILLLDRNDLTSALRRGDVALLNHAAAISLACLHTS